MPLGQAAPAGARQGAGGQLEAQGSKAMGSVQVVELAPRHSGSMVGWAVDEHSSGRLLGQLWPASRLHGGGKHTGCTESREDGRGQLSAPTHDTLQSERKHASGWLSGQR